MKPATMQDNETQTPQDQPTAAAPRNARTIFKEIHDENMKICLEELPDDIPAPGRIKRLIQEYRSTIRLTDTDFVTFAPIPGSQLSHVSCTILGASDTPYEGGVFHLVAVVPNEYPMQPPVVRFLTKLYHPKIDYEGRFYLSVLGGDWSPILTLQSVLVSITSLLSDLTTEDPLVPEISHEMLVDMPKFEKTASEYTQKYAAGERPDEELVRATVKEMLKERPRRAEY